MKEGYIKKNRLDMEKERNRESMIERMMIERMIVRYRDRIFI